MAPSPPLSEKAKCVPQTSVLVQGALPPAEDLVESWHCSSLLSDNTALPKVSVEATWGAGLPLPTPRVRVSFAFPTLPAWCQSWPSFTAVQWLQGTLHLLNHHCASFESLILAK